MYQFKIDRDWRTMETVRESKTRFRKWCHIPTCNVILTMLTHLSLG